MTSVMGRNIRGSLIALAVLVARRTAAAQAAVGPEAGVLTGFGDHTTQVGVRLTELSSSGGGTFTVNLGVGVIGRVAGPLALRADVTEHRFIRDMPAPFRSFTVGVTWLLR